VEKIPEEIKETILRILKMEERLITIVEELTKKYEDLEKRVEKLEAIFKKG
jgi:flagellar capping protein FliD